MSYPDCDHDFKITIRVINCNNNWGHQCQNCGIWRGIDRFKFTAQQRADAKKFDPEIERIYHKKRQALNDAEWQKKQAIIQNEQQEKREIWLANYRVYQESDVWAKKRSLALLRDNNQCQGCLNAVATHVHHLTYPSPERFGQEPLYWLVSLCKPCHKLVHDIKDNCNIQGWV